MSGDYFYAQLNKTLLSLILFGMLDPLTFGEESVGGPATTSDQDRIRRQPAIVLASSVTGRNQLAIFG